MISEGAPYRLTCHNKQGMMLDELTASVHVLWCMLDANGNVGTLFVTFATNDPKCTRANLEVGNYILFQHAELGNFGGPICFHNQRRWSGDKQVTIAVMAAEYQFNRVRAGAGAPIAGSAGAVFTTLCELANAQYDMLIRFGGSIDNSGPTNGIPDPKNRMISDIMKDVVKQYNVDWWLDPVLNISNQLVFNAYLSPHRGRSSQYVLKEGFNLEKPSGDFYIEEGELYNDVLEIGSAANNAAASKATSIDQASVDQYGLWQWSETVSGSDTGTTQQTADGKIASNSQPTRSFLLTALESPECPDTFAQVNLGDILTVDLWSVGFYNNSFGVSEQVRVMSREYSTDDNKVVLVVKAVTL